MPLSETIIHKIKREGPLSFHDFMEMAVYHPEEGYYACHTNCLYKESNSAASECNVLFGVLLGRQLEEMWNLLDRNPFTVVEYDSGHGTVCRDILTYLEQNSDLYRELNYCIIRKTPVLKPTEKDAVQGKIKYYNCISEVPFSAGCILSNEVLDNFAIHEVVMQKELMEVYIDYKDGFVEILKPAHDELKEYLAQLQVSLPAGYRTEINMEAINWLKENAWALQKGFILTIDYGFHKAEFFSLARHRGNLVCCNESSVYHSIGQQDITAHVNFSALHHWGNLFGLECCGYTSQAHFLHSLGLVNELDTVCKEDQKDKNSIQLYRNMMNKSSRSNILVQQKGLQQPKLAGLQFAKTSV